MKSEFINQKDYTTRQYPFLGYCRVDDIAVMFLNNRTGMVVYSGPDANKGERYQLGYYTDTWQASMFEKVIGEIILTNDNQSKIC
jgi:hypothetical protein